MAAPRLWKLQYAGADTFDNASTFAAALRQHLQYTPTGLTTVLQQIDREQSAYLIQVGCAGCAIDRCVPGCRVDLLRRVLSVGYAESQLTLVRRGLVERPYTRMVIGWPSVHAQPLDASVLQGWQYARLRLHWRGRGRTGHGLRSSVVMEVGDGADDPLLRLDAVGWRGFAVSWLLPWLRKQFTPVLRLWEGSWPHDPYLLTPVAAATHWLMSPPARSASTGAMEEAAGYGNAATIVHHLHAAGARIEMLDLDEAGWTAQVAATTVAGAHPRPVFEALRAPGTPLEVRDSETGTLALDPSQARPHAATPPLLFVGVRPNGHRRWRPLSATHHLVLSGPIEAGVILGMFAPAVESHGLRIGVLDQTEQGTLATALIDLPGRLPTADGYSPSELLGAIGSLPDQEQLTVVVLAVEDAAAAEGAMLPFLRAALYRPISVLLVVPSPGAIPAAIQHRCPLVEVRQRVARWQVPEGRWAWAKPTVLRLPWRDPQQSWSALPHHGSQHRAPLPLLDGFWAVPSALQAALGGRPTEAACDDVEAGPDTAVPVDGSQSGRTDERESGAAESGPTEGTMSAQALHRQRRSRVYSFPVDRRTTKHAATQGDLSTALSPTEGAQGGGAQPAQAPHMLPAPVQSRATVQPQQEASSHRPPTPASPLPRLPGAVPTPEQTVYTPREDSAGNLVVDPWLLVMALRWAEQLGQDERGIPMTRFKGALRLPSKAHTLQLVKALRLHGLIRREVRDGWYELLTVEEAVRTGKLPPGPWYTPTSADQEHDPTALLDARPAGADHAVTGVSPQEAHGSVPAVTESEVVA